MVVQVMEAVVEAGVVCVVGVCLELLLPPLLPLLWWHQWLQVVVVVVSAAATVVGLVGLHL